MRVAMLKPTISLAALVLLVITTAFAQDAKHVALITDLDGTVMVGRAPDGALQPAVWGTRLFQGDRVKTRETASVSILFSNNNLIALGPNSSMTISSGPDGAGPTQTRTVSAALLADISDLTLRRTGKGEVAALGGLRASTNDMPVELLSPRNTKVKVTRPLFAWTARQSFETYRVKLFNNEGLVWSAETTEEQLHYPQDAPPLQPDKRYLWFVEADDMLETVKSSTVDFRVLSDEELQTIAARENEIAGMFNDDSERSSYHFVLGAYYANEGLLDSAIESFTSIAERHPQAALPYELLGNLYHDVGLKDHAIEALQRTIALTQSD